MTKHINVTAAVMLSSGTFFVTVISCKRVESSFHVDRLELLCFIGK